MNKICLYGFYRGITYLSFGDDVLEVTLTGGRYSKFQVLPFQIKSLMSPIDLITLLITQTYATVDFVNNSDKARVMLSKDEISAYEGGLVRDNYRCVARISKLIEGEFCTQEYFIREVGRSS